MSSAVSRKEWLALLAIITTALAFRLYRLGALSFSGDEETTTLAAMALSEGWPPTLPGGLVYLRALPFTILEAGMFRLAGMQEWAMRLPPVLFASLRLGATWWLARPFLGGRGALAAAALLGLHPLDVEHSRTARMYSMFAAFDLLFIAAVVNRARNTLRGIVASGAGLVAGLTHQLVVTHAPVAWLTTLDRDRSNREKLLAIVASVIAIMGYWVSRSLTGFSYAGAGAISTSAENPETTSLFTEHLLALQRLTAQPLFLVLVLAGLGIAVAGFVFTWRRLDDPVAKLFSVGCLAAAALCSPALFLFLAVGLFLFEAKPVNVAFRNLLLIPAAGFLLLMWAIAMAANAALTSGAVTEAAKTFLGFPARNWLLFGQLSPLLFLLALAGVVVTCARAIHQGRPGTWYALIIVAFGPALIAGLVEFTQWPRYQFHALPGFIILALIGISGLASAIKLTGRSRVAVMTVLALVTVRPDLSLECVTRDHGATSNPFSIVGVAPDHRGVGQFIRQVAGPDDLVVAEDMLQMRLYAGRVDYWLRKREDAKAFMRGGKVGEAPRDIYTGALLLGDIEELVKLSIVESDRTFWLVTSAEVEVNPGWYRTPTTQTTLDAWKQRASFTGHDQLSRVYRVQAGKVVPPARSQ